MYPLKLKPKFIEKVWGGRKLETHLQKQIPNNRTIGESWELYHIDGDSSQIENGEWQGKHLHEIMQRFPQDILGADHPADAFPLFIKFIDADQALSVQVHPDDAHARLFGQPNGKTESWLALQGDPHGEIICGLRPGTDQQILERAIQKDRSADLLNRFPTRAGDVYMIKGGTVHAIGAGTLLLEIQQNSNVTFRIYDWGRLGLDGKPRPLHIREALQVVDYEITEAEFRPAPQSFSHNGSAYSRLTDCDYFVIERFQVDSLLSMPRIRGKFEAIINLSHPCQLESPDNAFDPVELKTGEVALLPASVRDYHISGKKCEIIRTYVPKRRKGHGEGL
ncbi:MAG: hypothetical protein B6244_05795 [Candidatus Cloacimonetes bacterium 4572_55]|nr:MAG: hypothetical protein B6244_05795 [Candidatus Cloacimonetes bacterium 4572_55]